MSALGYVIWVLHFPISQSVMRKFLCDGVLGFVSICKHIYKVFCVSFVTNASWRKIKVLFLFSFLMGHLNVLWKGKLFQHKCCCNETHYSISIFIYFFNFYIFYKFILVIDSLEWFGRKLYNWYNKSVKIPTVRRHFLNLQLAAWSLKIWIYAFPASKSGNMKLYLEDAIFTKWRNCIFKMQF